MEYRNSGVNTHYGGGVVSGVDRNAGTEILGSTITSVSDSAASNLWVRAQGAGALILGDSSNVVLLSGSTTPVKFMSGESTVTPPALAANSQGECTFTAAGISTGDLVLSVDHRNTLSTAYLPGLPYVGAADKIHVPVANCHASTISGSTSVIFRWVYLKRT